MKKSPNTNKTLILTIVCTLIVSLLFGSLVYAYADNAQFGDIMGKEQVQEDSRQRGNDKRQGNFQGREDSQFKGSPKSEERDSNEGPESDRDFGSKGEPSDRNSKNSPKNKDGNISVGEIKSIENNTVKIEVKADGKDQDSQTEEKSYTVSSDVDLNTFAAGDRVRFEADDNNQITSMIKVDSKDELRSKSQEKEDSNNSEQKDQNQASFSTAV